MKKVLVLTAVVLGLAMATQADIYVDFNDVKVHADAGSGNPGYQSAQSRHWNAANLTSTGVVLTDMVDEDYAGTSVDINVITGFQAMYDTPNTENGELVDWEDDVTGDSAYINNAQTPQIRVEGLVAGNSYDLTFYGGYLTDSTWELLKATMEITIDVDAGGPGTGVMQSYESKQQGITTFTGVVADASGYITIDFARESGDTSSAHLSGMSITPEPATMTLLGIGGLLALVRKRR